MPAKNHTFESSGPDVKIRGTAHQVHEKYLALARDALSTGDRIAAEGFFQFADHYWRLCNIQGNGNANANGGNGRGGDRQDPASAPAADAAAMSDGAKEAAGGQPDEDGPVAAKPAVNGPVSAPKAARKVSASPKSEHEPA